MPGDLTGVICFCFFGTMSRARSSLHWPVLHYQKLESNIRAPVSLNSLDSLQKRDKRLEKPCILSLFLN